MGKGFFKNKKLCILVLSVLLLLLILTCICLGRYQVSPYKAFMIIYKTITGDVSGLDVHETSVVIDIRLPRILMGVLVGAGLSLAGAAYQTVFSNPLVSPDLLGVSSGAGFGAALSILLSLDMIVTQHVSLLLGLLAVYIVLNLSRVVCVSFIRSNCKVTI